MLPVLPETAGNGLVQRTGVLLEAACRLGQVECAVFPVYGPCAAGSPLTARLGLAPSIMDPSALLDRLGVLWREDGPAPRLARADDAQVRGLMGGAGYDLVYIARTALLPLLPAVLAGRGKPRIVFDLDEHDGALFRRLARLRRGNGEHRLAAWEDARARAVDALFRLALPGLSSTIVSSARERALVAARFTDARVAIIPNAAPLTRPPRAQQRAQARFVFVGNFAYYPNADAALWLVREIWPRIRRAVAGAQLTLAGQGYEPEIAAEVAANGITLITDPADIADAYADAAAAVVPLRVGGGTRIKVLEAAALSIPVVATSIGVEGLDLQHGRHVAIADDALSFARACIDACVLREAAAQRAERARIAVLEKHARPLVLKQAEALFKSHLPAGAAFA
jgi:glycosyltransferase involved in cell wall biosynthesis